MRLHEAHKRTLIESRYITPMPILEDGEAPRWNFKYDKYICRLIVETIYDKYIVYNLGPIYFNAFINKDNETPYHILDRTADIPSYLQETVIHKFKKILNSDPPVLNNVFNKILGTAKRMMTTSKQAGGTITSSVFDSIGYIESFGCIVAKENINIVHDISTAIIYRLVHNILINIFSVHNIQEDVIKITHVQTTSQICDYAMNAVEMHRFNEAKTEGTTFHPQIKEFVVNSCFPKFFEDNNIIFTVEKDALDIIVACVEQHMNNIIQDILQWKKHNGGQNELVTGDFKTVLLSDSYRFLFTLDTR
jgi:hypothetical protein